MSTGWNGYFTGYKRTQVNVPAKQLVRWCSADVVELPLKRGGTIQIQQRAVAVNGRFKTNLGLLTKKQLSKLVSFSPAVGSYRFFNQILSYKEK